MYFNYYFFKDKRMNNTLSMFLFLVILALQIFLRLKSLLVIEFNLFTNIKMFCFFFNVVI